MFIEKNEWSEKNNNKYTRILPTWSSILVIYVGIYIGIYGMPIPTLKIVIVTGKD